MHKTCTPSHCLLDWLLVLAIVLAPMQDAFSASGNTCKHEHNAAAEVTTHHAAAINPAGHDAETSPAQDCCNQNCGDRVCTDVCNQLQTATYPVASNSIFPYDNHRGHEPKPVALYIGRSVPTLFRPPPASV